MGFLLNLLGGSGDRSADKYSHAMMMTNNGKQVARVFLENLEIALDADNNYNNFFDTITGQQGISTMKTWYRRFTKDEIHGHNLADWLQTCTKICFEQRGTKELTDVGITKLCEEVRKLL